MFYWAIIILLASLVILITVSRPQLFWLVLVGITIGTGPLFHNGLSLADEILLACLLVSFGIGNAIRSSNVVCNENKDRLAKVHQVVFLIMCSYMLIEALRGVLIMDSPRKIRWIVYFCMLGITSIILSSGRYKKHSGKATILTIIVVGSLYFVAYIFYGIFAELARNVGRYFLQNTEWAGTSYAVFPIAAVVPASLIVLNEKKLNVRNIAWVSIILALLAAIYYDSRIGILAIGAFLVIYSRWIGWQRIIVFITLSFLVFVCFASYFWPDWLTLDLYITGIVNTIADVGQSTSGQHDIFRITQIKIAFPVISTDLITFLFGYGLRAAGDYLAEYTAAYTWLYNPKFALGAMLYRSTEGFTALVAESGFIGITLFATNAALLIMRIYNQKKCPIRGELILTIFVVLLWLFISNLIPFVLLYFMLMPSGLFMQMSRYDLDNTMAEAIKKA